MKKSAITAALILCLAVPAFASDVSVSAFGVYESKYHGCEAKIVTPVVNGMLGTTPAVIQVPISGPTI